MPPASIHYPLIIDCPILPRHVYKHYWIDNMHIPKLRRFLLEFQYVGSYSSAFISNVLGLTQSLFS